MTRVYNRGVLITRTEKHMQTRRYTKRAKTIECSYHQSDPQAHDWQDHCFNCAPFWIYIKVCPTHNTRLTTTGYCSDCKMFYNTADNANS